jgi:hypothetical protein
MARRGSGTLKVPTPYAIRRAAEAFDLKAQRKSYQEVAVALGCSKSTAYEAVELGAKLLLKEHGAEAEVAQMIHDIEEAMIAIMPKVRLGDLKAIEAMCRVHARWARLKGLDQPTKVNIDGQIKIVTEDALDAEINRLAAELGTDLGDAAGFVEVATTGVAAET